MTSHEFAKLLLSHQDQPLYIQEHYECCGEWGVGYSYITGVESDVVEEGFIITTDYLEAEPNDTYYNVGDFIVEGINNKFECGDFEYMVVDKHSKYLDEIHRSVGFYEGNELYITKILSHTIKVFTEEGWHPEPVEMTLEEARVWYKDNFNFGEEG